MRVFAKRSYAFDPVRRPIIEFGKARNRDDALIQASEEGDCLVFVGTQSAPDGARGTREALGHS